ncbi:MAG TPA: RibD family protein [Chloroflexota bacterium]|nr:RibD family protein [Chloroflexota bacterium]
MDQHRGLHITLKLAQSLDGRIATSTGESRWISGPESRTAAHRLRAEHDAVLIGVGTVLADNPRLDVRLVPGPDPLRVIVDSRLRTPPTAAVFRAGSAEVLIAADSGAAQERREALSAAGATVIVLPRGRSGIDLGALFAVLEERGVGSILVEGGARLATSVLRERLADSLALFIAMKVIGRGRDAIGDLGIREVSRAVQVDGATVERLGEDIFVRGRLPRRE